jgi:hypothetical protein
VHDAGRADIAALAVQRGERRNRPVDHGVMADDALADAFFADDPAAALATYTGTADPDAEPAEAAADDAAAPETDDAPEPEPEPEPDAVDPVAVVAVRPVGPDRSDEEARLAAIFDREDRVRAWVAEVEANGTGPRHLVVWLAPVVGERARLEADLPRLGAAVGAGRIVVERPSVVRQRLEAAGGSRFVDHP